MVEAVVLVWLVKATLNSDDCLRVAFLGQSSSKPLFQRSRCHAKTWERAVKAEGKASMKA